MTRVTIALTLAGLIVLFVAYAKGVSVIHGGDALSLRGGVRPYAVDPDHAKALWAKSEAMVGERF